MIKVEVEEKDSMLRLILTTNDESKDLDNMDLIGNAIITKSPKLGGYLSRDKMVIDIKKPEKVNDRKE